MASKNIILDLFMKISCIFPIFTVCTDNGIFNKLLFALIVVIYLVFIFKNKIKIKSLVNLAIMLVCFFCTLLISEYPLKNNNMLFYFPFFVAYTWLIIDYNDLISDWLKLNQKYIMFIIRIWSVIVGISIFIPNCYYIKEGGASYFGSFTGTIFRLGPSAFFIQVLVLSSMSFYKRKKDIIYMIIPLYCYFTGSSRTYLIIGLCLFVIAWYWYVGQVNIFYFTLIPLLVIGFIFILQGPMMNKIAYTLDKNAYGDFWYKITSSRSLFWAKDLHAWIKESFWHKLTGSGIEFTMIHSGLWGHNDFIEIMCSFGLIGLVQYIVTNIKMLSLCFFKRKHSAIVVILLGISWFFNAFFNMYYTYFCCMLSLPLAVLAISNYYKKASIADS